MMRLLLNVVLLLCQLKSCYSVTCSSSIAFDLKGMDTLSKGWWEGWGATLSYIVFASFLGRECFAFLADPFSEGQKGQFFVGLWFHMWRLFCLYLFIIPPSLGALGGRIFTYILVWRKANMKS